MQSTTCRRPQTKRYRAHNDHDSRTGVLKHSENAVSLRTETRKNSERRIVVAARRTNATNGEVVVERVMTSDAFLAREIKKAPMKAENGSLVADLKHLPNDLKIVIQGAREHNLRNVDLEFPRNRMVVFRIGQVLAGVRYAVRRGPASLCRVIVGVCTSVPRSDGQARRRLH